MNVIKELYDIIEEKLSEIKLSEIQTLFVILIVIFMGILASDGFLQQYISSLKIRSVPTLIAFSGGNVVMTSVGSTLDPSMKEKIESL